MKYTQNELEMLEVISKLEHEDRDAAQDLADDYGLTISECVYWESEILPYLKGRKRDDEE